MVLNDSSQDQAAAKSLITDIRGTALTESMWAHVVAFKTSPPHQEHTC